MSFIVVPEASGEVSGGSRYTFNIGQSFEIIQYMDQSLLRRFSNHATGKKKPRGDQLRGSGVWACGVVLPEGWNLPVVFTGMGDAGLGS